MFSLFESTNEIELCALKIEVGTAHKSVNIPWVWVMFVKNWVWYWEKQEKNEAIGVVTKHASGSETGIVRKARNGLEKTEGSRRQCFMNDESDQHTFIHSFILDHRHCFYSSLFYCLFIFFIGHGYSAT